MKKLSFYTLGYLVIIFNFFILFPKKSLALDFDSDGDIQEKTKLATGNVENIIINIVQWVLGFLGLIAVVMIIIGGYTWMTAGGNEEKVTKAKRILQYAVIGLVITVFSFAIVTFIFDRTGDFTG